MELEILLSSLQLAVAIFQLRLDHFSKSHNRQQENQLNQFNSLGEAIRALEYALAETTAHIGQTQTRENNPRLARLWEEASVKVRNIEGASEIAQIAFEKNLYWSNPSFYENREATKIYWISLDNVLNQLRALRNKYDKLGRATNLIL